MFAIVVFVAHISGTMLFLRAVLLIEFRTLLAAACLLIPVFVVDTIYMRTQARITSVCAAPDCLSR